MITAVDTNIILDILIPGAPHADSSKALLDDIYAQGALIISEVVYAELAARFPSQEKLDEFLQDISVGLEQSQQEALYLASEAWRVYNSRRRQGLQCTDCGRIQVAVCPQCGKSTQPRQHILSDFLIGGHALKHADRLLTRDRGYYRTYFPSLSLQERL
jgi:predicted nucleic acid-binding protein